MGLAVLPRVRGRKDSCTLIVCYWESVGGRGPRGYERGTSFHGLGLETDESVPFGNRFLGYRFQITIFHIPLLRPLAEWEDAQWNGKHPIEVRTLLGDICHSPTKDGSGLIKVLEKQLGRCGASMADVVSGTTDGGGENVGKEGMHSHLEGLDVGYTRRRGLEHLSWRVCNAGLEEAGDLTKQSLALSAYLHEGIAWTRLMAIATQPLHQGGLALMGATSQAFADVFARAPPSIREQRPETDMLFLRSRAYVNLSIKLASAHNSTSNVRAIQSNGLKSQG